MILRLTFIFLLFLTWGPAAKAVLMPDTHSSSVVIPDTRRSSQNKPPDTITLEANVVQIILNDEHRGGIDWAAIVSDFHTVSLKKTNDPLWNDKKYRLSFGTLSEDDYAVLLDALDIAGQVSQFPKAPIKVISGTPAGIDFKKQNIRVDLLLSRLKSGDLSLRIDPYLTVTATEIWNGEKIPSSVILQSETRMLIADNTTIVIGGFMKEEEITRTHKFPLLGNIPLLGKIPLLGNIPIVGLVFRSRGHLMQKTETVVFLTVRTNAVDAPAEDDST